MRYELTFRDGLLFLLATLERRQLGGPLFGLNRTKFSILKPGVSLAVSLVKLSPMLALVMEALAAIRSDMMCLCLFKEAFEFKPEPFELIDEPKRMSELWRLWRALR
jgi:hypothetical protein